MAHSFQLFPFTAKQTQKYRENTGTCMCVSEKRKSQRHLRYEKKTNNVSGLDFQVDVQES
jgi:hypothetical protein